MPSKPSSSADKPIGRGRQLLIGQLIGQGSLVMAIPVLTRLIGPGEFGTFQLATAFALVLQPLATLRTEFVIPSTNDSELATRRRVIALTSTLSICLAFTLGALALASLSAGTAEVLGAIAMILLTYGWMAVENAHLIRTNQLGLLALRNALAGVIAALLQIALVSLWPVSLALAGGLLVGRLLALLVTPGRRRPPSTGYAQDDRYGPRRALPAILSGMIASSAGQLPVIYTAAAFGSASAGQVGLAQRVAGAPTTLVGQALGQLVTARAAPIIREQGRELRSTVLGVVTRLSALSALSTAALAAGGPLLAAPLLGDGWEEAGVYLAVFSLPLSLQFVALPVTPLFVMLGRERLLLGLQTARLGAMVVGALAAYGLGGNLFWTCIAMAAAWTAAYMVLIGAAVRISGEFDARST